VADRARAPDPLAGVVGATPLDPDEADGLLPPHIATQEALNAWENANIARARRWALGRRRDTSGILTLPFVEELHRRMFDRTWRWAGRYRATEKNIGLPVSMLRVGLRDALDDARVWLDGSAFAPAEAAARLHHRLVLVHPWPNGNGRWARLVADTLLRALDAPPFTWGSRASGVAHASARIAYLDALRAADRGDFAPLLSFVRS
jgi:Fic-DOC domain mobile mystery protein B